MSRPVSGMYCRYRYDNSRYYVAFVGTDRSVLVQSCDDASDLALESDLFDRYFVLEDVNE